MDCAANPGHPCNTESSFGFINHSRPDESLELRRCLDCGHAVTRPKMADVRHLYGDRDSQDYQPDIKNSLSRTIKNIAFRIQARRLLSQIPSPGPIALDYGCGSGQFTRILNEELPNTSVVGSDFFDSPPAELCEASYITANEAARREGEFDLVMAMHVLEHDDDAEALLASIVGPAKSGATVVVEVPNVECFGASIFGRYWDSWYVPFHRHHFSKRSLTHLLSQGGLQIVSVHAITAPTMGRTMANLFGAQNNLFWLVVGIALHPVQWIAEKVTGQATAIRVIALKT